MAPQRRINRAREKMLFARMTKNPLGRRYTSWHNPNKWIVLTEEGPSQLPRVFLRKYLAQGLRGLKLPKQPIKPGTRVFRFPGNLNGLVVKVREPVVLQAQIETLKLINIEHAKAFSGDKAPTWYELRPLKIFAMTPEFYVMEHRNVPDAQDVLNSREILANGPEERAALLKRFFAENPAFHGRELVRAIMEMDRNIYELAKAKGLNLSMLDLWDGNYLIEKVIPLAEGGHKFKITLIDQPKDN